MMDFCSKDLWVQPELTHCILQLGPCGKTSLLELAFFCRRMSNVVPIMSVKAWLAGTNDYLSGDPLAGRVGQSLVVVMVGEDGCSAGM